MSRLPLALLAALAGLLALALLLEARGGGRPDTPMGVAPMVGAPMAGAPMAGAPTAVPLPQAASSDLLQDWVRTTLDRPIFSPSRRPGVAAVASTEVPRLAGIIVGPNGARAIFAGSGDARAVVAAAGGRAGPYLIRAVGSTGVSVLGPNGAELLRPARDPGGGQAAASPPAPSGPPSILDLLRSRVQTGEGLRSSLLPATVIQPPIRR